MPVQKKVLIIDDEPKSVIGFYQKAVADDHRYDKSPDVIRKPDDITKDKLAKADIIILDFVFENSSYRGDYVLKFISNCNSDKIEIHAKIILLSSMKNYSQWDETRRLKGLFDLGVTDFIVKSIAADYPEIFKFQLDRALELLENAETVDAMQKDIQGHYRIECPVIVGQSDEMGKVLECIDRVAKTDSTVLITGESGTGKEKVARTIHCKSKRRNGPFVGINCAAIPLNLIESELFGHERGSFTGAISRRIGHFEKAKGGTIFLDEIAEMDSSLQAKLLRIIQEKEFERIGGTSRIRTDVRIIAATNKDLIQGIENKGLRNDLYWRLNVLPIHIPPLRNHSDDIEPLAKYFLDKKGKEIGKSIQVMSNSALQKLRDQNWPGNVRELENIIERAIVMASGSEITGDDIDVALYNNRSQEVTSGGTVFFDTKGIAVNLIEDYEKTRAFFEEKYGLGKFAELENNWEFDMVNRSKYLDCRQFKFHDSRNYTAEQKLLIKDEIKKHLQNVRKMSRVTDKLVSIIMGMSHRSLRGMLTREKKKKKRDQ